MPGKSRYSCLIGERGRHNSTWSVQVLYGSSRVPGSHCCRRSQCHPFPTNALRAATASRRGQTLDHRGSTEFLGVVVKLGYRLMVTELDVNDWKLVGSVRERDAAVARHTAEYLDTVFGSPPNIDRHVSAERPLRAAAQLIQESRRLVPTHAAPDPDYKRKRLGAASATATVAVTTKCIDSEMQRSDYAAFGFVKLACLLSVIKMLRYGAPGFHSSLQMVNHYVSKAETS
jgi:hypothetical protein